jgi:hypothetical protein
LRSASTRRLAPAILHVNGFGIGSHLLEVGHREPEVGEDFFHGDGAVLLERIEAYLNGGAILFGQLFVIALIDHDFQQGAHRAQFGGRQQIE